MCCLWTWELYKSCVLSSRIWFWPVIIPKVNPCKNWLSVFRCMIPSFFRILWYLFKKSGCVKRFVTLLFFTILCQRGTVSQRRMIEMTRNVVKLLCLEVASQCTCSKWYQAWCYQNQVLVLAVAALRIGVSFCLVWLCVALLFCFLCARCLCNTSNMDAC